MIDAINMIKKYVNASIEGDFLEIDRKMLLFSLRKSDKKITNKNLLFLRELKEIEKDKIETLSDKHFIMYFKTGETVIEIEFIIKDKIKVIPYINYNEERITNDFERLVYLDHLLYAILKEYHLQT